LSRGVKRQISTVGLGEREDVNMGQQIAVLGLGAMGSRMAARLLDAGHELVVYNRDPMRARALEERGATAATSPKAAAQGSDVVITIVRDDEASRAVWLDPVSGALSGMKEGAVAVESSTVTPSYVSALSNEMAKSHVELVDAPVVGSRPQAEAGQLIFLVGGESELVDQLRKLLLVMGSAVHHVGPIGTGAVMKLTVNALLGIQVAALGELLGMTRRAGVSDEATVRILAEMPVTSPAAKAASALMAARRFEPLFPIELMEKDLRYVADTSRQLGSETPTASAARAVFQRAIDAGLGSDNMVGVMKLFE
jgi:3-hydroxyisobutyrate dehydrogenase